MQNQHVLLATSTALVLCLTACSVDAMSAEGTNLTPPEKASPATEAKTPATESTPTKELKEPEVGRFDSTFYGYENRKYTPSGDRALFNARKHYNAGRLLPAYKTFKQVLAQDGIGTQFALDKAMAYCGLADCYVKDGNYEYAAKLLDNASQLLVSTPELWRAKFALAKLRLAEGKKDAAVEEMVKALELCESLPAGRSATILCRQHLAKMYGDDGKFDLAKGVLAKTAAEYPEREAALGARAAIAYYLAKEGKDAEAEKEHASLCADISRHHSLWVRGRQLPLAARNRAVVLRKLGDEPAAKLWEQKAAEAESERDKAKIGGKEPEAKFDKYMPALQRKIKKQWHPPKSPLRESVVVLFEVKLNGEVDHLKLVSSSGNGKLEATSLEAVQKAAPFAPLPQYTDEPVEVLFTFDYNGFRLF